MRRVTPGPAFSSSIFSGSPYIALALLLALCISLAACGGSSSTPPASLSLSLAALPAGTVDAAYSASIAATGGSPPYSYAVSQGSLPSGLALSSAGSITGTPKTAGTSSFTVTVTDSKAATASSPGSIVISAAAALTIAPASLPDAQINAPYSQTFTASGGTAPYTFSLSSGSLPSGLTLANGVLSGTPTASGNFNFTISAQDSTTPTPLTGSNAYTLAVSPSSLTIAPATLPNATVNVAYGQALTASGGTAPYTFSIATGGTLPPGLELTSAGVFTGAPTATGTYTFTVLVEDSTTPTPLSGSVPFTLTVNAAALTGNALLNGNYFFRARYYDYLNAGSSTSVAMRQAPARHGFFTQWAAALAHPLPHAAPSAAHAIPAQGSFNSPIVWGVLNAGLIFDGNGNITSGEFDSSNSYGTTSSTLTGTYAIFPDNTGTMTLYLAGSSSPLTFNIAVRDISSSTGLSRDANVIENTPLDNLGDIEYGTGVLNQQVTADFALATLTGNFVLSGRGETCYTCAQSQQGNIFSAGLLGLDGAGSLTGNSLTDITTNFSNDNNVALAGTFTAPDAYGRATLTLATTGYSNGSLPQTYAIYIRNLSDLFLISTDPATDSDPFPAYFWAAATLQDATVQFSNSTVIGNYLIYGTTEDLANETAPDSTSDAFIYLLAADGNGNLTGTGDLNAAGTISSGVALKETYTVASNGRVTITGGNVGHVSGGATPIFWLINAEGGGVGLQQTSGTTQEPGGFEFYSQSAGQFSNASISGQFGVHTSFPATSASPMLSGILIADGNGNLAGDLSLIAYYTSASGNDTATYSISPTSRGTITGAADGIIGNSILYVGSPDFVVTMDESPGDVTPATVLLQR
jgi:hypothetical protein